MHETQKASGCLFSHKRGAIFSLFQKEHNETTRHVEKTVHFIITTGSWNTIASALYITMTDLNPFPAVDKYICSSIFELRAIFKSARVVKAVLPKLLLIFFIEEHALKFTYAPAYEVV